MSSYDIMPDVEFLVLSANIGAINPTKEENSCIVVTVMPARN